MTRPAMVAAAILVIAAILFFFSSSDQESAEAPHAERQTEDASATSPASAKIETTYHSAAVTPLPDDFDPTIPRHGGSLFGELKYGADFSHFDYVNTDAPKGGTVRFGVPGSYDSLNGFIVKGQPAVGLGHIYDTLMKSSLDEAASDYGLLAESVRHPADYSSVTYTLRANARWHDGKPVTAEDVIWTFGELRKSHPFFNAYYANVAEVKKTGPHEVTFRFDQTGNRELPHIVGQLPVLPKHYWTGTNAQGKPRNFGETTLEPPLGSGPYKVGRVSPGRSITYERVADYWGADLPVNKGSNNFDAIRYEYYRDGGIALEAFKGDKLDLRLENSAKNWATEYNTPAVRRGEIIRQEVRSLNPQGMQAFAFNLRREKFSDPRVRQAFNWAFDFEWANKNLFYDQYSRIDSYFANSELASKGLPEGRELAILEEFRDELPASIFDTSYENPVTDGSGNNRTSRLRAISLFEEAGWRIDKGKLVNAAGERMSVEFLLDEPTFERVVATYRQSLERLGIEVTIRLADAAQYQNRVDNRDFDIIVSSFPQSLSPGNEQREFWGCTAAKENGSRNVIGICEPVIDKLIERLIFANDREELIAATRALDRVLLAGHYVVPQWYSAYRRIAFWKRLKHPETMPPYSIGFPEIWWFDQKAPAAKPDEAE